MPAVFWILVFSKIEYSHAVLYIVNAVEAESVILHFKGGAFSKKKGDKCGVIAAPTRERSCMLNNIPVRTARKTSRCKPSENEKNVTSGTISFFPPHLCFISLSLTFTSLSLSSNFLCPLYFPVATDGDVRWRGTLTTLRPCSRRTAVPPSSASTSGRGLQHGWEPPCFQLIRSFVVCFVFSRRPWPRSRGQQPTTNCLIQRVATRLLPILTILPTPTLVCYLGWPAPEDGPSLDSWLKVEMKRQDI